MTSDHMTQELIAVTLALDVVGLKYSLYLEKQKFSEYCSPNHVNNKNNICDF